MKPPAYEVRCSNPGCYGFANASGRCPPHDGRTGHGLGGRRRSSPEAEARASRVERAQFSSALRLMREGRLP